jgi:hypothetical protein
MGAKLAKTLPHARLITVEGGGHNDLFLGDRSPLFDQVPQFVRHSH